MNTSNGRSPADAPAASNQRSTSKSLRFAIHTITFSILTLLFTAGSGLALDHSGVIASNETWFAADNPHVVTSTGTVNAGVTLTIEAGAEVRINASQRLTISGTLDATGTSGQEILFTKNTASNWGYLIFSGAGTGTLDHCTIEYSGNGIYANGSGVISVSNALLQNNSKGIYGTSTNALSVSDCQFLNCTTGLYASGGTVDLSSSTFTGNTTYGYQGVGVAPNLLDANVVFTDNGTGFYVSGVAALNLTTTMNVTGSTTAGIHLANCDGVTVDNQVVTGSTGLYGAFFLDDCGEFTLGAGNTIGGTGLENTWPVTIAMGSYPSAAGVIPTTGNTNNDIHVYGGDSTKTGTWRKFTDLDYIVTASATISAGGGLTIEPAVNLKFGPSRRLTIYGSLTAVGTSGQEILFTKSTASAWGYLIFSGAGTGTLDHCTIEYSGNGVYANGSGTISLSNTLIENGTNGIYTTSANDISVSDCLIQNNSYGVKATSGAVTFLRSRIINNTSYGVYLASATPVFGSNLTEWNEIYGNGTGQPGRDLWNHVTDIDARYVYWGTMDHPTIMTQIWDWHDNLDLGYVQILPFTNAAHDDVSSVEDGTGRDNTIPTAFGLYQNAPNPFNPSTVIHFDLTKPTPVQLKIFDISGALVATLIDGQMAAGRHEAPWRGRDDHGRAMPSGVYFYRIVADQDIETREMMLIK